ncbi:PPOX class F420-dependent oxidoreductase [Actinoplanes sp. NPDC048967]|uniref:PPOX class F420-dependent oxidoreductase n=1 Tax=Actinoplanes sp. NPDC048967 TaxID=3155269 RepID=UPI0033EB8DCF
MTSLPAGLLDLLGKPSPCFIATTMPDGSPQLTQTWVGTDGEHIVINTVEGYQKVRNVERDPRVAVTVADPDDVSNYYSVRGRVVDISPKGGAEHIEELAQKYVGGPYPWFGGRDQVRVILTIEVEKIVHAPWG